MRCAASNGDKDMVIVAREWVDIAQDNHGRMGLYYITWIGGVVTCALFSGMYIQLHTLFEFSVHIHTYSTCHLRVLASSKSIYLLPPAQLDGM